MLQLMFICECTIVSLFVCSRCKWDKHRIVQTLQVAELQLEDCCFSDEQRFAGFSHVGNPNIGYGHSMRGVAGSPLGRNITVGGIFHPARQLARFSPPNM